MKEIIITAILGVILLNVISYLKRPELSFSTLPLITVPMVNGSQFQSAAYHDKPLIIHFWATWCPTCKLEIANFSTLSKTYPVMTIAVQSGSNNALKAFMQEHELDFQLINDRNGVLAKKFSITAYPTTLIFDSKGKLAFSEVGYSSVLGMKLKLWWLGIQ